jgi:hypothetical protein
MRPEQEGVPPGPPPNVPPPDVTAVAGQTRLIVQEVVRALESKVADHRHSDFVFMISAFGLGFLVLAGMLITGYLKMDEKFSRLDDRITTLNGSSVRVDTKLEDLLQPHPACYDTRP